MMRWDGWIRGGLQTFFALAFVILGNLPVLGQEKPATKPTTKPTAQPEPPKPTAAELLATAKTAYQQKNYQGAVDGFRKFIKAYPNQPEAPSARYGLALALAAMPQPDYNAIVEALTPTASANF